MSRSKGMLESVARVMKACAVVLLAAGSLNAQAILLPLQALSDGTVWDPNTHLIWLKHWNVNGAKDWNTQNDWAEGLDFAGSSDWHLPTGDENAPAGPLNQFGKLYAEFGAPTLICVFNNVQTGEYWSGTPYYFAFSYGGGGGGESDEASLFYAVAVRAGDPAAVPEPPVMVLMLLALGAAGMVRRRGPV